MEYFSLELNPIKIQLSRRVVTVGPGPKKEVGAGRKGSYDRRRESH